MSLKKAVVALQEEAEANSKLQGRVYLEVSLSSDPVTERQETPILVPLPNRFRRKDEEMICLVVKDPSTPFKEYLGLFDEVIGVGKLRRRIHGSHKKIQEFTDAYTTIYVQDKVHQALIAALGPSYLKRTRRLPVVVNLDDVNQRELEKLIRKLSKCTQLVLKPARSITVLVGNSKMETKKLQQNVRVAAEYCQSKWPTALFHIKTPQSMALPFSTNKN